VQARIADGLPKGFRAVFGLTTALDEQLRGPVIDAADECQALMESVARTEGVEFVFDGPALYGRQRQLFERLATAMARCPNFAVEIGGHTSGGGDPDAARALAERWAQAVAEAMMRAGAERPRLRAVGYGNARPVADIATEAGRQRNRRIVFRIVS
jgi:outer membrane protein OmpA-like peptidoglycan-associated protein